MDPATTASSPSLCRCAMQSLTKWPMTINIIRSMTSRVMPMQTWWMITRHRGGGGRSRARGGAPLWVTPGSARAPLTTASRRSTATQVRNLIKKECKGSLVSRPLKTFLKRISIICTMWVAETGLCNAMFWIVSDHNLPLIGVYGRGPGPGDDLYWLSWFKLNKAQFVNSIEDARPGTDMGTVSARVNWCNKACLARLDTSPFSIFIHIEAIIVGRKGL